MNLFNIFGRNLIKYRLNSCKLYSTQTSLSNVSDYFTDNVLNFNHFKSLAINKRIEAKIKIILNEYQSYRDSDEDRDRIPSYLTVSQMKELLDCHHMTRKGRKWFDLSQSQRKHLFYLMKRYEETDGQNRLTEPLMPSNFEKFYENRLKNGLLFGQNVVFDLSFDKYMNTMECKNLSEQFYRIYRFNRYDSLKYSSEELPFTLNLCNVDKSGQTFKFLEFLYPNILSDNSFVNITSESYLDVFPKSDIVYLSPHAEHVMTEYDNSAVFIIGGIVDRREVITLSYPKAVQQNIRSMRLPIDLLIRKTNIQALDSVFRVLFDFKAFGVNNYNLNFEERIRKHIPNKKLKSKAQTSYERLKSEELSHCFDDFDEEFDKYIDTNCN